MLPFVRMLFAALPGGLLWLYDQFARCYWGKPNHDEDNYQRKTNVNGSAWVFSRTIFESNAQAHATSKRLRAFHDQYMARTTPRLVKTSQIRLNSHFTEEDAQFAKHSSALLICVSRTSINMLLDHEYLGAEFFNGMLAELSVGSKAPVLSPPPTSVLAATAAVAFMSYIFPMLRLPAPQHALFAHPREFVRMRWFASLDELGTLPGITAYAFDDKLRARYAAAYALIHLLSCVMRRRGESSMRVMMTLAFQSTAAVINNVGVIVVELPVGISLDGFIAAIKRERYQVAGSVYAATSSTITGLAKSGVFSGDQKQSAGVGERLRRRLHMVMSLTYCMNGETHMSSNQWTYMTPAEYPIYGCGMSRNNECWLSVTQMSPDFPVAAALQQMPGRVTTWDQMPDAPVPWPFVSSRAYSDECQRLS